MVGSIVTTVLQACPSRVIKYAVNAMPTYANQLVWTIPTGGTIINSDSLSVTVLYTTAAILGYVTVQPINNCASGSARSIRINLPSCGSSFAPENIPIASQSTGINATVNSNKMAATIFPNPSTSSFNLVVSNENNIESKDILSVQIIDIQGRVIKKFETNQIGKINFGNDLNAGSYIVEIKQGGQTLKKRILKF
jgi:hypothetical protein